MCFTNAKWRNPEPLLHLCCRHRRSGGHLSRIEAGDSTIPAIVANVYEGLDPALTNAAAASVRAHIEDLVERALVRTERSMALGALYRPA
ncbi:MAG: hypothetical protein M3178_14530 [Pseudomonadota bacterium]|nr:hypothetical protein [Pseudomonadota bacterium]